MDVTGVQYRGHVRVINDLGLVAGVQFILDDVECCDDLFREVSVLISAELPRFVDDAHTEDNCENEDHKHVR